MERENFIILFLEQENSQLKAKELILEKEKAKLLQQVGKGKEIIESSKPEGSKEENTKNLRSQRIFARRTKTNISQ